MGYLETKDPEAAAFWSASGISAHLYPRRAFEVVSTVTKWGIHVWKFYRIRSRVMKASNRLDYMDVALTPVADHEEENLDLMQVHADLIPLSYSTKEKAALVQ